MVATAEQLTQVRDVRSPPLLGQEAASVGRHPVGQVAAPASRRARWIDSAANSAPRLDRTKVRVRAPAMVRSARAEPLRHQPPAEAEPSSHRAVRLAAVPTRRRCAALVEPDPWRRHGTGHRSVGGRFTGSAEVAEASTKVGVLP